MTSKIKNNKEEVYHNKNLIMIIAEILNEIINEQNMLPINKSLIEKQKKFCFYSPIPSLISIKSYIERLCRFTHCEECSLIMALIYIDRVCERMNIIITKKNIYRLFLICLITSIKYNEDECYTNSYYAKIGGLSLNELNDLEYELLNIIEFVLYVDFDVYEQYRKYLTNYHSKSFNNNFL